MNWLTKKNITFRNFGLVLLSALFSCEDPSSLGISLIDPNDDLGVLYTEIPLDSRVVLMDSINTTNQGIAMTGHYSDGDFGELVVRNYMTFVPLSQDPVIPDAVTQADSVIMNLRYNYYFGPDEGTHQLGIHRLTEGLEIDKIYYSFDASMFEQASLEDTTFMVSKADTLLRLDVSPIGDELLNALKEFDPDSVGYTNFLQQFKGFALNSASSSNAVLGFNNAHADSKIVLYYTTNDTVVNAVDLRFSNYYNGITTDYTGTELEGIEPLTDFSPASGRAYAQAGVGLVPKIDFQPYHDFIDNDTTGTLLINRAELVMENLTGVDDEISPPQQLSFFFTNQSNEITLVGEQIRVPGTIQTDQVYIATTRNNLDPYNTSVTSVRAEFDTVNTGYKPEITLFLQFVFDGALPRNNTDVVLSIPYSYVEAPNSVRNLGRNVNRFVVEPGNLRLEIFYTRLK
jgi:hypothetical protein